MFIPRFCKREKNSQQNKKYSGKPSKRLIASREDATTRRWLNQSECVELLTGRFKFECILPSERNLFRTSRNFQPSGSGSWDSRGSSFKYFVYEGKNYGYRVGATEARKEILVQPAVTKNFPNWLESIISQSCVMVKREPNSEVVQSKMPTY